MGHLCSLLQSWLGHRQSHDAEHRSKRDGAYRGTPTSCTGRLLMYPRSLRMHSETPMFPMHQTASIGSQC